MADGDGVQGDLLDGGKGTDAAGADGAGDKGAADAGKDAAKGAAAEGDKGKHDGADKGKDAKGDVGEQGDGKSADAPADFSGLKLPEGYSNDPKDPVFGEALKLFGDHKIAPDVAQKFIDFTVNRDKAMATALNEQNAASWTKQVDGWKEASAKEFSEEDLGGAKTALPQLFDKETAAWLEGLGLTNHPGFIRGLVKVSKAIKDDTFAPGNAGHANGSADARRMYPNSNMNA